MFRLGGITWWKNNYGSVLQAYALQEKIKENKGIDYYIVCQFSKNTLSKKTLLTKIKEIGLINTIHKFIWKYCKTGLRKRNVSIQEFVNRHLKLSLHEYDATNLSSINHDFDGFVFGSDQIWNLSLVDIDSIYWGGFANEEKKMFSYAPSVGLDSIPEKYSDKVKFNLNRFIGISCREESGTFALNNCLGEKRCITVLDPTMLVNRILWDDMSNNRIIQGDYIFVYLLRGTKEDRVLIEKIAKKVGMKIYYMPFLDDEYLCKYDSKMHGKKIWSASPEDFINFIRYAKIVITDSFHCSVFSVLYHVDFYTLKKIGKNQMNRILKLQEQFEIESRMISPEEGLDSFLKKSNIDWKRVDSLLNEYKEKSQNYLNDMINKLK